MKLLVVFFGNDYHGGSAYSTATVAKELARRGHDVHAYVRKTSAGTLASDLRAAGVTVHDGRAPIVVHPLQEDRPLYRVARFGLERIRHYYQRPKAEREIRAIIRDCGIELVALSSGAITAGAKAAREAGVPYVWHRREFMEEDHGLEFYPWACDHELMRGARSLICVSRAVEDKMLRLCPGATTTVVYNGIDQEIFHPNGRTERNADEPLRLMFSGGIRRSKGAPVVLDALAQLPDELSWTLDLFGREGDGIGESAKELAERCRELGIADRVTYRGTTTTIADEYRSHDVAIIASRAEAFGRVTAEAMLCGCAVVGSNSGGTPELISEGRGYLFEPNDPASLAEALAQVASDDAGRASRTAAALAFARENFSVNAYVDKIEAIYRSAVA